VADEQKVPWWKSLPGLLTAATGFVAALSGLVAGLNQLGVFRHPPPGAPVVASTPASRDTTPQPVLRADTGRVDTVPGRVATRQAAPPSRRQSGPAAPARRAAPAPAPSASTRTSPGSDSTPAQELRLPTGTALELAVPKRTCAPRDGKQRFTARLTETVKVAGTTVLRTNTTGVLHLRRGDSGDGPLVRLDSLVGEDVAASVPAASVRIRRGADGAACLRANARIRANLGAPVTIRRR
jgi:hypothetical protein